jgi:hypothetical protein
MKTKTTENHRYTAAFDNELTITKEQYDRLIGYPLNLETREGRQAWVNAKQEWFRAVVRGDGSWGFPFSFALFHSSSHGSFLHWMMEIINQEVYMGHHSQKSLDESLSLCEKLIPTKDDWISGSALHEFMGETREFSWWCNHIRSMVARSRMPIYRHRKVRLTADRSADTHFMVNTLLASQIALSAPTTRGDIFRKAYFTLENTLLNPQRL